MKIKKRTIFEVDSDDLGEIITKYFQEFHDFDPESIQSQKFEFIEMQHCEVNSYHNFNFIDGKLDEYDLKDLQRVINTKNFYESINGTELFLNYLCAKSVIEPGDYLVLVSY